MEVLNSFMTWIFKSRLGQIDKFKQDPHAVQKATLFDLLEAKIVEKIDSHFYTALPFSPMK